MMVGSYRDRVRLLVRTLAAPNSHGERVEGWPDPGSGNSEYWCRLESPAGSEDPQTIRQSTADYIVKFRNEVAIEAVDRVKVLPAGDVYAVVGVWSERAEHGGRQTVVALSGKY